MILISKLFEQGIDDMQTGDGSPQDWSRMGLKGKRYGTSTSGAVLPTTTITPEEKLVITNRSKAKNVT